MTTERLDRLESLAETILLAIQQLANQQQHLANQQQQLQQNLHDEIVEVVGIVNLMVQENGKVLERIDLMQSEIRGLQVENRRMIERWNSHTSDGHGGEAV